MVRPGSSTLAPGSPIRYSPVHIDLTVPILDIKYTGRVGLKPERLLQHLLLQDTPKMSVGIS